MIGLSGRTLGQYPVSIATSLALEGLTDTLEDGKRFSKPPLHQYHTLWVNLRTLVRNVLGSTDRETATKATPSELAMVLVSECEVIDGVVKEFTQGRTQVVFYYCTYENLSKHYPKALFKEANTLKQKHYAQQENTALSLMRLEHQYPIVGYDTHIRPEKATRSVILSHYPFDLLAYDRFTVLDLIESHTGVIKKKHQWNTKLLNGKTLTRIPFDRMTIQLFGDSGGLLGPYPPNLRKLLVDVAEKHRWNTLTTPDRIKLTVKVSKEPALEMLVSELYR